MIKVLHVLRMFIRDMSFLKIINEQYEKRAENHGTDRVTSLTV